MKIILKRIKDNGKSTIGILRVGDLELVTIEDTRREKKVYGETRISSGTYEIKLRKAGKFYERYKSLFGHKGVFWLQNVPDFEYILFHSGNTAADSEGCIIVGTKIENDDFISSSLVAYQKFYNVVYSAFERGERVFVQIYDN